MIYVHIDAWDALEKRLECFQLMLVAEMPPAIAGAYGAPNDVEKIAATIKAAHEVGNKLPLHAFFSKGSFVRLSPTAVELYWCSYYECTLSLTSAEYRWTRRRHSSLCSRRFMFIFGNFPLRCCT